ncbi:MAG: hypothetical protein JW774_01460 [Candidatus Aureabacteria bacterium]|nr:hypothetical protein [Candidatus Auribacterota bacterium]
MTRWKPYLFAGMILFICQLNTADDSVPSSVEEIKISLNSQTEINNALNEIKADSPKDYEELKEIQKKDQEEFKLKLHNRYYTLMHKKVLLQKMPPRTKGYRELVKESETGFAELKKRYNDADETAKSQVEDEIRQAAENRFSIELDYLKKKEERAKRYFDSLTLRREKFEKNKLKHVQRMITRCKAK